MPKIMARETRLGLMNLPLFLCPALNAVRAPKAKAGERDPGDQPKQVEWQPEDKREHAVPKGHREADPEEGNEPEKQRASARRLHGLKGGQVYGPRMALSTFKLPLNSPYLMLSLSCATASIFR